MTSNMYYNSGYRQAIIDITYFFETHMKKSAYLNFYQLLNLNNFEGVCKILKKILAKNYEFMQLGGDLDKPFGFNKSDLGKKRWEKIKKKWALYLDKQREEAVQVLEECIIPRLDEFTHLSEITGEPLKNILKEELKQAIHEKQQEKLIEGMTQKEVKENEKVG